MFKWLKNYGCLLRGIVVIWTIQIKWNELVFNNERWNHLKIQGTIWEPLVNHGKAPMTMLCLRSIKLSLTENRKLFDIFDKSCDRQQFICAKFGMFGKFGIMMDLVKVYQLIGWLEHVMALPFPFLGVHFFPFLFTMNSLICAKIILIITIMTLKHHHQYLSHPILLHHKMSLLAQKQRL